MSACTSIGTFGSPAYLVGKFADVSKAVVSRKSAMAKRVKAAISGLATKRDNMFVFNVLATSGIRDGAPCKGYVAHIVMGLNGPGRQEDYLAAMRKLVTCRTVKMRIFDAWVDACDDLVDVLVSCEDAADTLKKGPAK